jgi:hypothetical protein
MFYSLVSFSDEYPLALNLLINKTEAILLESLIDGLSTILNTKFDSA